VINAEVAETIRAEVAEKNRERLNAISGRIIDAALRVHTVLGPGLLESAYEVCFAHELRKRSASSQGAASLLLTAGRKEARATDQFPRRQVERRHHPDRKRILIIRAHRETFATSALIFDVVN